MSTCTYCRNTCKAIGFQNVINLCPYTVGDIKVDVDHNKSELSVHVARLDGHDQILAALQARPVAPGEAPPPMPAGADPAALAVLTARVQGHDNDLENLRNTLKNMPPVGTDGGRCKLHPQIFCEKQRRRPGLQKHQPPESECACTRYLMLEPGT